MAAPRTERQKEIRRHLWIYGALTPYVIIAVFPIYWMVITAFKQDRDLYRMDLSLVHLPPTKLLLPLLSTNYVAGSSTRIAAGGGDHAAHGGAAHAVAPSRRREPGRHLHDLSGPAHSSPLARSHRLQDSWWSLVLVSDHHHPVLCVAPALFTCPRDRGGGTGRWLWYFGPSCASCP
jgi:ABC-type glycerol-3-phosphate transport system permease component